MTYKTLAGAYASMEKAGATPFDITYNGGMVFSVLESAYKRQSDITVAKWNLVKQDKTLYALESVDKGFKWTAVAHFDSDGLLYPIGDTPVPAPKTNAKGKRKPTPTKDNKIDFGKVSGKTKSERNKGAHKLILDMGVKIGTDEYKSLWAEWTKVR